MVGQSIALGNGRLLFLTKRLHLTSKPTIRNARHSDSKVQTKQQCHCRLIRP